MGHSVIGGTYYHNQDRFITYACQKDNERKENWTKWELGLQISKSEPLGGNPESRRNDGTADGTSISKYLGRDSRRNSKKLDSRTERPTKQLY